MSEEKDFFDNVLKTQHKGEELADQILTILDGHSLQIVGAAISYVCGSFLDVAEKQGMRDKVKATLIASLDILSRPKDEEKEVPTAH